MNRVDRALLKAKRILIGVDTDVYIVTYWPKSQTDNEHAGQWEVLFHAKNRHTGEIETVKKYFQSEEEAFNFIDESNSNSNATTLIPTIYNDLGLAEDGLQCTE